MKGEEYDKEFGLKPDIMRNGMWGFVDKTDTFVIPSQFADARHFKERLALVKLNNRFGFIDKTGALVVNPQFDKVTDFKEGRAWVMRPDHRWGVIDKTGTFVVEPIYSVYAQ